MNNRDTDFESWFSALQSQVLDRAGVNFRDEDSVRGDFDEGRDVFDVADEIVREYAD